MSFIPYQIDYSVQNTAKTIGFSKKRVIFKFGFANMTAIRENKIGVDCRGSEHEIIFIWSLLNGKRQLICNHKDIHYSESKQNGWTTDHTWQHVFVLHDHHTNQKYRIHFMSQKVGGSSNSNSNSNADPYSDEYNRNSTSAQQQNNQHPFDLRIGNLSYFQFNPIYQLGTPRMIVGQLGSHNHQQRSYQRMDSPMLPEERQQLAAAKLASLQDIAAKEEAERQKRAAAEAAAKATATTVPPPPPTTDDLLISFDDDNNMNKNPLATTSSTLPTHVPTTIQATATTTTTTGSNINSNSNNQYFGASSITMDQFDMSQDLTLSNRQQPGSFYNFNNNTMTTTSTTPMTNPYASTATINPYASTAATTTATINPYNPSSSSSNVSTSSSTALTPYQALTTTSGTSHYYSNYQTTPSSSSSSYAIPSAQQSYVDSTGRLNIGIPPLAPTTQTTNVPPPISTYNNNNNNNNNPTTTNYYTNPYNNTNNYDATTTNTNPLSSPSGTTSVWTYGSEAPSFAQPPQYSTTNTTSTIHNPSYYGGSMPQPQQQTYGQQPQQPQTYPYNY